MTGPQISPALARAYAETVYEVRGPAGSIRLSVGMTLPVGLLGMPRRARGRGAAIVTAANPASRMKAMTVNRLAGLALATVAKRAGLQAWPCVAVDPNGLWPEEHGLCLFGITPQRLDRLLRRFNQNAAVIVDHRRPAFLRWRGDIKVRSPKPWETRAQPFPVSRVAGAKPQQPLGLTIVDPL